MTINFGGAKNSGAIILTTLESIPIEYRIWMQPTNKMSKDLESLEESLLKKRPLEKDGFFKMSISPENIPLKQSYISINGQETKFTDMKEEDVNLVEQAKNYLKKFANKPEDEFSTDKDYLDNTDLIQKKSGCDLTIYESNTKKDLIEMMHRPDITKNHAEAIVDTINEKLTELLMSDATL